jgi:diaphanous 2
VAAPAPAGPVSPPPPTPKRNAPPPPSLGGPGIPPPPPIGGPGSIPGPPAMTAVSLADIEAGQLAKLGLPKLADLGIASVDATKLPAGRPKTRQFFWDKLSVMNLERETIWCALDTNADRHGSVSSPIKSVRTQWWNMTIDEMDVCSHFRAAATVAPIHKKAVGVPKFDGLESGRDDDDKKKAGDPVKSHEVLCILDKKKVLNTQIAISGLQSSSGNQEDALLEAVCKMEDSSLNSSLLENLIKFFPSDDEAEALSRFKGDPASLSANLERMYLRLFQVAHNSKKRLQVSLVMNDFSDVCGVVEDTLDAVNVAAQSIRSSLNLRTVFGVVLRLGNTLNFGTKNGNAYAFRLSALAKLRDLKTSDNTMSLLHFVVLLTRQVYPEALNLVYEMNHVHRLARVEPAGIASDVKMLREGIASVQDFLEHERQLEGLRDLHPAFGPTSAYFTKVDSFYKYASVRMQRLITHWNQLNKDMNALMAFFAQKEYNSWDEFILAVSNFVVAFGDVLNEIEARERNDATSDRIREAEKKRKDEAEKKRKEARAAGMVSEPQTTLPQASVRPQITDNVTTMGPGPAALSHAFLHSRPKIAHRQPSNIQAFEAPPIQDSVKLPSDGVDDISDGRGPAAQRLS